MILVFNFHGLICIFGMQGFLEFGVHFLNLVEEFFMLLPVFFIRICKLFNDQQWLTSLT